MWRRDSSPRWSPRSPQGLPILPHKTFCYPGADFRVTAPVQAYLVTYCGFVWLGLESCRAAKLKCRSETLFLLPHPGQGFFQSHRDWALSYFLQVQTVQVRGGRGARSWTCRGRTKSCKLTAPTGNHKDCRRAGELWPKTRFWDSLRAVSWTTGVSSAPSALEKGKENQDPQVPGGSLACL